MRVGGKDIGELKPIGVKSIDVKAGKDKPSGAPDVRPDFRLNRELTEEEEIVPDLSPKTDAGFSFNKLEVGAKVT